ncbi:Molybdenum-pterin binding domain-containing protein [Candidatus Nitrotoga sp. HW29]|uniref:alginate export family protein n=1 Tax=Candidatus Nitrotoga sp. HW29 TaxID=2886963 RepID=UPI001EF1DC70|nr:alginate export family protein [Candidatus Nitrotoga sp. HW29]CAH1903755.1 Molybdenum-pterin binding domain-containing protein [Candidatus Nitrotoga sp. HW29]
MIKTFYYPLGKMMNKAISFKEVTKLIEFRDSDIFKIKMSESSLRVGILASSLLVASPYSAAQESTQLKPQQEKSGLEVFAIDPPLITAQADTALQAQKTTKTETAEVKAPAKAPAQPPSYYVQFRSSGLTIQTEPPRYVKQANKTWLKDIDGWQDVNWLDIGAETRLRYESRENDFRRKTDTVDEPFSLRTRLYAAVKNKFDPLRATFEFQDSRRFNQGYPYTNLEVNKTEFIQGFGELYFKDALGVDALGNDRPLSLRVGRMAFELTDKRLIARNEYRNTTNNFQGYRVVLGQRNSDWEGTVFAFNPIVRFMEQADKANEAQWFYGAKFDVRKWSKVATFQPYYYLLQQNGSKVKYASSGALASAADKTNREINTGGLRAYGIIANTGIDWDLNYVKQWGTDNGQDHDAYGYNMESGYTFSHAWKPRVMANLGYASGDKNPNDNKSQRFERLFGFARPWSHTDYIQMENVRATKVRGEFSPTATLKLDFGYSWYKLASATDRWSGGNNLRDATGKSGKNIGDEFDMRAQFPVNKHLSMVVGYSYFMAGDFAKATSQKIMPGRGENSHLVWIDATVVAF